MEVKRAVIIVVVLGIVLVIPWMLVLGIAPLKKMDKQLIERPVTVQVSSEETALSLSDWLEKEEKMDKMFVYHESRRDPFLPAVKKKEKEVKKSLPIQPPKLVLKGIAYDEAEPLALINDLVVKEGDAIQEARIVKIDFDQVTVWYVSKKFVIKLIEWEGKETIR